MVRDVPAAWDETRGLSAALGEQVAVARRKGDSWYIGAMTNEAGRTLDLPLGFLAPGRYRAEIWQDGKVPTEVVKTVRDEEPDEARRRPGVEIGELGAHGLGREGVEGRGIRVGHR